MSTDLAAYRTAVQAASLPEAWAWSVQIRPARRTLGATVEPGGPVVFTVPPGCRPDELTAFAQTNRYRLAKAIRAAVARGPQYPVKELVNGEGFPLLGTNHRVQLVDDADTGRRCPCQCRRPLTARPGVPIIGEPGHATWSGYRTWQLTIRRDQASAATVAGWYQQQGQAWVDEQWPAMAARLGIAPGLRVKVRAFDGKTPATWARYTPKTHTITIHWALFQLDHDLVELTLAHELAHAARPPGQPHGPAWANLLARLVPDWRDRARRKAEAGRHIWIGAISTAHETTQPAPVSAWATLTAEETTS